jgi:hypothetical protein
VAIRWLLLLDFKDQEKSILLSEIEEEVIDLDFNVKDGYV